MPIVKRFTLSAFSASVAALLLMNDPAAALECSLSWGNAQNAMNSCNIGIADNNMCLVATPVFVSPANSAIGFERPEDTVPLRTTLKSITGEMQGGSQGFTMLKVVTQGLDSHGRATPFTQAVVMIAFGRTTLDGIESPPPPSGQFAPSPICRGSLKPTADGEVTGPGAGGPISEAKALERFDLLGRSASGDKILVRLLDGSTGWMDQRDTYLLEEGACVGRNLLNLQVVDSEFNDVFLTPQQLQYASSFQIRSEPAEGGEALECVDDGYPPSGLLIFSPSGTDIVVTINNVLLRLGSSALVGQYRNHFVVLVLEGEVEVVGRQLTARAGETLIVPRSGRATIERGPSRAKRGYTDWCDELTQLARAVYTVDGRLRVPYRRIDFCSSGSAGYAVPPSMIVVQDPIEPPPNRGNGTIERPLPPLEEAPKVDELH